MANTRRPEETVPQGKIHACLMPDAPPNAAQLIRPCRPGSPWMDRTPGKYAYRCTPLSAANTMGWELLNPVTCECLWNGLTPESQLVVYNESESRFAASSHFGSGMVTWHLPFVFRTPPGFGMVVTGPANHDKCGAVPAEAFVRTDWLPFPFTMNWRLTTPRTPVRFEQGEAICRIYPYPVSLLNEMEIELHRLEETPQFAQAMMAWGERRKSDYEKREELEQQWLEKGGKLTQETLWNRQYAHGRGAADVEHETVFHCKPVRAPIK